MFMKFTKSPNFIYFAFIWHGFFLALTVLMLDLNTVFPALVNTLTESKILFGAFYSVLGGLNPLLAIYLGTTSPEYFAIIFFILGFMISGRKIGFEPYLLDIIPKTERVEYL